MIDEYDVVVVGSGVGGLSAAVSAAENGAKVILLDRAPEAERGGQSRYTEAYLRMKSHREVSDDFEEHLAENGGGYIDPDLVEETLRPVSERSAPARALNMVDPEFIQSFASNAGMTIAWLEGLGVRLDFLPTQFLTKSQPRLLPVGGGQAIIDALAARATSLGVIFMYDTTALKLDLDKDQVVVGLFARSLQHGAVHLKGQVVLACGGFEGNPEMLTRYLGPRSIYLRPVCKAGHLNRGEGIQMALDIGAAPCGEFGSYHAEPVDPRSAVSEPSIFIFPYGILVNKEGRRFADEAPGTIDAYYERVTRRIYEQSEGIAYTILDAKHTRIPNYRLGLRTDQPPIEAGSLNDLARKLNLPVGTFLATVQAYNSACVDGEFRPLELDHLATKGLLPPKSNWAVAIDEPPFHAYPVISANVFTFGGLKVDTNGRVLNTDGYPIPGLYAAGEIVGSFYHNYTGATSVLKGLVFGRLSGIDITQRLKKPKLVRERA